MRKYVLQLFSLLCCLAVQAFSTVPTVSFTSGSGASGDSVLTFAINDPLGVSDIQWGDISIGAPGASSCMVEWTPGNYFSLFNDAGNAHGTAYVQGSAVDLSNSQCTLHVQGSSSTTSGTSRSVTVSLHFNAGYGGTKAMYVVAGGSQGHDGWHNLGNWLTGSSGAVPITTLQAPASGGTGSSQAYTLLVDNGAPASGVLWSNFSVGNAGGSSTCTTQWNPGYFYLLNDSGVGWLSASIGSGATLENAQCKLLVGGSSISINGNYLQVTYSLQFKAGYSGSKTLWAVSGNSAIMDGTASGIGRYQLCRQPGQERE